MHQPVSVQTTGGIAVITIDSPPHNALGSDVRLLLARALEVARADHEVAGVLIAAKGRSFASAEAPDAPKGDRKTPSLSRLCLMIESFPRPVAVAIHGKVFGPGLELALAAHYRIADRRAELGFPEVREGLSPRGGATQRLPRLVGLKRAMDLLLTGQILRPREAMKMGIVDAVAPGPLPAFALQWIKDGVALEIGPKPVRDRNEHLEDPNELMAMVRSAREGLPPHAIAVHRGILDGLEAAAIMPFEAGLAKEEAIFEDCRQAPETKALRYVVRSEDRAGEPPVEGRAAPVKVIQVGVVGGGRIGSGVVASCLEAGFEVVLVEKDMDRLEESVEGIIDIFDQDIGRGRLDAEARDRFLGHLSGKTDPASLMAADLVIEATPEDPGTKRRIFAELDAVMKRDAILATTTSSIDIDGLAAGTGRAPSIIGLHFFPPANRLRVVEVAIGVETSNEAIATAFAFAKRLGKVPVASAVSEGYIAYRMFSAFLDAALAMMARGTPLTDIDAALETYGFPLGPFRLADALGLDTAQALQERHSSPVGLRIGEILSRVVAAGRAGRKSGRGFLTYRPGNQPPVRDGGFDELMTGLIGSAPPLDANAILRHAISALANQGLRLVEDQVAQRPSDIDVVMMQVFGYPRHRGGPMMAADQAGLPRIKRDLDRFAEDLPEVYAAAPLMEELIKSGKPLSSLND